MVQEAHDAQGVEEIIYLLYYFYNFTILHHLREGVGER